MASRLANLSRGKKILCTTVGIVGVAAGGTILALNTVGASGLELHPPSYPWPHRGLFSSFDHASLRRGYEVYKNVCAACHSLKYIHYHHLIGVTHTEEEAKAEAASQMIEDGPDDEGKMYMRPGRLYDHPPSPYPNAKAARFANNGAYPPDLSWIVPARHGEEDYIFSLLTGYCDPPAGIVLEEGQYYNPYFHGGALSMAQALHNETLEYEDGTPATASQLAKDVSSFLAWTGGLSHDARKKMFVKFCIVWPIMLATIFYWKRWNWQSLKSRKIIFETINKRPAGQ